MNNFKHKIAFIIPTRNRPELLGKLLRSIQDQTVMPHQVIIVDGSDISIEPKIKEFLSPIFSYNYVFPPSLTKQRNAGIKQLDGKITLAGYLDDDVVLENDAVEKMLLFWEHCPDDVGGTSFNIINAPKRNLLGRSVARLFCMDGSRGKVLPSGFNTDVYPLLEDTYTEWLCGGATVWRKEILENYKYDEWYVGCSYQEDTDFSFQVAKKYKLIVVQKAKLHHNPPPYDQRKNKTLGKMNVIGRYHFVRKHAQMSVPMFYWGAFGEILYNITRSICERNMGGILLASGNLSGLFHIIKGNLVQEDEIFRKG